MKSLYDHRIAERYMRFVLAISEYGKKKDLYESARTAVFKSLEREATNAAFGMSDFSRTLTFGIREEFALQYLACRNLMTDISIARNENIPEEVKAETTSDLGICIEKLSAKEEGEAILRSRLLKFPASI